MKNFVLLLAAAVLVACSGGNEPPQQVQFLEINQKYSKEYDADRDNDAQKELARKKAVTERATAINEFTDFTDWEANVSKVKIDDFMDEGKTTKFVVLEAKFGSKFGQFGGVTLVNSDRNVLGVSDNVLKETDSLYEVALSLKENQKIKVSGKFRRENGKIVERSLTESGGMIAPEYVVTFTKINGVTSNRQAADVRSSAPTLPPAKEETSEAEDRTSANPVHDQLYSMPEQQRRSVLAANLVKSGENCPSVTKTFYQGSDDDGNAFWNVACDKGDSLVIQINNDGTGTMQIISCKVLKAMNAGTCFTKFKN
jgi:hypothetical protein